MNLWNTVPYSFYEALWGAGALSFPKVAVFTYIALACVCFYRKDQRKLLLSFFALSLAGLIGVGTYWVHRNAFITPLLLLAIMVLPFCVSLHFIIKRNHFAVGVWLLAFLSGSLFSLGAAAWFAGIAGS